MSRLRAILAACGCLATLLTGSTRQASAQVAFAPTVSPFPNGVMLNGTPVVSDDRRYVRLTMNPIFTGLEGFTSLAVPGAVGGGGINGGVPGLRSVGIPGQTFDAGMDGIVSESSYRPYGGSSSMLSGGGYVPGPVNLGIETIPRPKAPKALSKRAQIIRSRR